MNTKAEIKHNRMNWMRWPLEIENKDAEVNWRVASMIKSYSMRRSNKKEFLNFIKKITGKIIMLEGDRFDDGVLRNHESPGNS